MGQRDFTDRVSICLQPRHCLIIDVAELQTLSPSVLADADPVLSDLPWLMEVHSNIWNREDLRPDIFRRVEVTRAHYNALQKLLKELHPDRDSWDYNGNKADILKVKLDFLLSLPRAEASTLRHYDENDNRVDGDDDPEANNGGDDREPNNEDNAVLNSLFPSLLSFLDLSTLELKATGPGDLSLPILLRKEYNDISDLIKMRPGNSGGSVIVSGQPGMGEFLVSLSHRV